MRRRTLGYAFAVGLAKHLREMERRLGRVRERVLCALAASMITSCAVSWTKAPEEAHAQFVLDYTCPANRVVAAEEPAVPPDDVRADPERMRLWNEQHEAYATRLVRVQGCGHSVIYRCYRSGHYSEFMHCSVQEPKDAAAPPP